MRIVASRGVNFPIAGAETHQTSWSKCLFEFELGAKLSGGQIGQRAWVPLEDLLRLARGNPGLELGITRLQGRVAAAMVTVQMGVHENIKGAITQNAVNQ